MVVKWLAAADWQRWDRFANQHPLGGIVHTSAWKSVIEQSFPHIRGRYCALIDRTSGEIVAGMPVYRVSSPLLGNRLVSIPFATISDPLVSGEVELSQLLAAVQQYSEEVGASRIEIRCASMPAPSGDTGWYSEAGFKQHVLPLDRSQEEIPDSVRASSVRARIAYAERKRIARAEKAGMRYRSDSGETSLRTFYRLFLLTRRRLALPPIPYSFFRALHTHLAPRHLLSYALVESNSTPVAAGLVIKWRTTSVFEYLGDQVEQRRDGANQLLYWGVICDAIREGRETFSFGRTAVANEGLLDYKRRWGTRESNLTTLVFPASQARPDALRENCWKYRLVRRLCEISPLPLYRLLGLFCYRHLG